MQKVTTPKMKELYQEIRNKLFNMIPEKWESIYLYSSILRGVGGMETGEMFFYYFPKGILKKNPVNVYEIPSRFSLDEESYMQLVDSLYASIKELRGEFRKLRKPIWDSMTIKIEKLRFIVELHYDGNTHYNQDEKHVIWQYQNLKVPLDSFNKNDRAMILRYLEEEVACNSTTVTYEEPLYEKGVHNTIEYGKTATPIHVQEIAQQEVSQEEADNNCQEQEEHTIKKRSQILQY